MGSDPHGHAPVALVRVRFTSGPLAGAVVELPVELADPHPGQLLLTASGGVYDRHRNWRRVAHARVLHPPYSTRSIRTINPRPATRNPQPCSTRISIDAVAWLRSRLASSGDPCGRRSSRGS